MLTARRKEILNLIVADYVKSATPVASEAIVRNHDLGVSPATIRNEVAALEDEGYIVRPHLSAGSVPSEKGYRLYVETFESAPTWRLPSRAKVKVRNKLSEVERDIDEWTSSAAAILASLVGNMAIASFPKAREAKLKHVEIVRLQDFLVLLILVFEQARLRRQLVRIQIPIAAAELQSSSNKLSSQLQGLTWRQIEGKDMELNAFERELLEATVLMLRQEDRATWTTIWTVCGTC